MLKIKLFPKGKKHQRTFRIVVAEARSKFNGKVVADLGFVTPQTKTIQVNKESLEQWVKNGAQVTTGVDKILNPEKYPKKVKVKETKAPQEEMPEAAPAVETEVKETPVAETEVKEAPSEN